VRWPSKAAKKTQTKSILKFDENERVKVGEKKKTR